MRDDHEQTFTVVLMKFQGQKRNSIDAGVQTEPLAGAAAAEKSKWTQNRRQASSLYRPPLSPLRLTPLHPFLMSTFQPELLQLHLFVLHFSRAQKCVSGEKTSNRRWSEAEDELVDVFYWCQSLDKCHSAKTFNATSPLFQTDMLGLRNRQGHTLLLAINLSETVKNILSWRCFHRGGITHITHELIWDDFTS